MVVLGVDVHKRSNTAVAVDGSGRKLVEWTIEVSRAGHLEPLPWARRRRDRTCPLEREMHLLAEQVAPMLLSLTGRGHLTAAKLVGQSGVIGRIRWRVALARHNRTAPVPVWSGNIVRHRLDRGGERQLNVALHRIAAA
ncbi:MAG: transposase [Chloroflexi bacterium]|nr:transposase [Chloroflexota bacterium]